MMRCLSLLTTMPLLLVACGKPTANTHTTGFEHKPTMMSRALIEMQTTSSVVSAATARGVIDVWHPDAEVDPQAVTTIDAFVDGVTVSRVEVQQVAATGEQAIALSQAVARGPAGSPTRLVFRYRWHNTRSDWLLTGVEQLTAGEADRVLRGFLTQPGARPLE